MKFRKKPVVIEAHHYEGNAEALFMWVESFPENTPSMYELAIDRAIAIDTLEGTMTVSLGDWVIRGVKGEFYPCKPDIFAETYERVE